MSENKEFYTDESGRSFLYRFDGFEVYRQEKGSTDWVKMTDEELADLSVNCWDWIEKGECNCC